MALKKEDKVRLDGLEKTFTMLANNNLPQEQILEMMKPQFGEFEITTGSRIRTHFGENPSLEVIDLSKDFIRVRFPNEKIRVLRAKSQAVPIDIKLFKRDDFDFSNDEVAFSLRSLADEIDTLPMQLNSLGVCDVRDEKRKSENISNGDIPNKESSMENFSIDDEDLVI